MHTRQARVISKMDPSLTKNKQLIFKLSNNHFLKHLPTKTLNVLIRYKIKPKNILWQQLTRYIGYLWDGCRYTIGMKNYHILNKKNTLRHMIMRLFFELKKNQRPDPLFSLNLIHGLIAYTFWVIIKPIFHKGVEN